MLFAKLEEGIQSLTIFTKISILEDSKYVSLSDQKILEILKQIWDSFLQVIKNVLLRLFIISRRHLEWICTCNCLNVKELFARYTRYTWNLSDWNGTRTHNHLVCKPTFNHGAKRLHGFVSEVEVHSESNKTLEPRQILNLLKILDRPQNVIYDFVSATFWPKPSIYPCNNAST